MSESPLIQGSFSFYPADMRELAGRVDELAAAGLPVKPGRLLRALMHLTTPEEMYARTVKKTTADALALETRPQRRASRHPTTADAPKADWAKIDHVLERLARAGITQSVSFVMRATLAGAPRGKALLAAMQKFREEVPNKPRGLSKLRLEARRRSHG